MAQRGVGDDARAVAVARALEPRLGPLEGAPAPLEGGITNHNFRARMGGVEYVIRVHGQATDLLGIDREAERLAGREAAALGISPAVAAELEDCLVTRFTACEAADASEVAAHAEEIAVALRAFHESGVRLPTRFWVPDLLDAYATIVRRRRRELPAAYAETVALAARIGASLGLQRPRPCHNDLLPGNLIRARDSGRMMLIDWEYAGMGHPCFDLGNLAVNNDFDGAAEERLLRAYHRREPHERERATLKLMRVMSDAREAAWGVVQSAISALDFDFDGYADSHFQRLLAAAADPDFERLLATARTDEHGREGM